MSSGSSKGSRSSGQSSGLRASLSRPFRYIFVKRKNQEAGQSSNPTRPCPKPVPDSSRDKEPRGANLTRGAKVRPPPVETDSTYDTSESEAYTQSEPSEPFPATEQRKVLSPIRVMLDEHADLVTSRPIANEEDRVRAVQLMEEFIRNTFGDITTGSESSEMETMQTIGEEDYLADLREYDANKAAARRGKEVNFDAGKEIIYITDSPLPPERDVIEISSDSSQPFFKDIQCNRDRSPSVTMGGQEEDDPMESDEEPRRNDMRNLGHDINNQLAWARIQQGLEPNQDPYMDMIARAVAKDEATVETVRLEEAPRQNIPRSRKPRMSVRTPEELGMGVVGRGRPRTRATARKSVSYRPSAPMYDPLCTACGSMTHVSYVCPYLRESEPPTPNLIQCVICCGYGHWAEICPYRYQGGGSGDGAGPSGTAPIVTCPFAHLPYPNRIALCGCVFCRNP